MTHLFVCHDLRVCETWIAVLLGWRGVSCTMTCSCVACDVTHLCVCHDSFICVTWLIHVCAMTCLYVRHEVRFCLNDEVCRVTWLFHLWPVTWLICLCAMTHLFVCHDSFICAPWLIYLCVMTHLFVWHDLFHLFVCHDSFHLFVCHDLRVCKTWRAVLLWRRGVSRDMTHSFVRHFLYIYIYIYI